MKKLLLAIFLFTGILANAGTPVNHYQSIILGDTLLPPSGATNQGIQYIGQASYALYLRTFALLGDTLLPPAGFSGPDAAGFQYIGTALYENYLRTFVVGPGLGTVTVVNTGYGVKGGPIVSTGTIVVDTTKGTGSAKLATQSYVNLHDTVLKNDANGILQFTRGVKFIQGNIVQKNIDSLGVIRSGGNSITDSIGSDSNSFYINGKSRAMEHDTVYYGASNGNTGGWGVAINVSLNNIADGETVKVFYRKKVSKYSVLTFPSNAGGFRYELNINGGPGIVSGQTFTCNTVSATSVYQITIDRFNTSYVITVIQIKS